MAPLKKSRENLTKRNKVFVLGGLLAALLVVSVVGYQVFKSSAATAPGANSPGNPVDIAAIQKSRVNNADVIREHIQTKNWEELSKDLANEHRFSQALTEIQKALSNPALNAADQAAVFEVLKNDLVAHKREVRDWNLLSRTFASFNLSKGQGEVVRAHVKKIENRLQANLLFQSFLGTVPYPTDLKQNLIKNMHGKDLSESREVLYFVSLMKDRTASRQIYENLLKTYGTLHSSLQPFAAKTLLYSQNEDILKSAGFEKIRRQVHSQKGEVWKEVQAAFDSKVSTQ